MMELFILILLDVQANDHAPTSFCPSSFPIPLPYSSEVDEAKGMYKCIPDAVEGCERTKERWPDHDFRYQKYIFKSFARCFIEVEIF